MARLYCILGLLYFHCFIFIENTLVALDPQLTLSLCKIGAVTFGRSDLSPNRLGSTFISSPKVEFVLQRKREREREREREGERQREIDIEREIETKRDRQ